MQVEGTGNAGGGHWSSDQRALGVQLNTEGTAMELLTVATGDEQHRKQRLR